MHGGCFLAEESGARGGGLEGVVGWGSGGRTRGGGEVGEGIVFFVGVVGAVFVRGRGRRQVRLPFRFLRGGGCEDVCAAGEGGGGAPGGERERGDGYGGRFGHLHVLGGVVGGAGAGEGGAGGVFGGGAVGARGEGGVDGEGAEVGGGGEVGVVAGADG